LEQLRKSFSADFLSQTEDLDNYAWVFVFLYQETFYSQETVKTQETSWCSQCAKLIACKTLIDIIILKYKNLIKM
jgi:hypothetical protein